MTPVLIRHIKRLVSAGATVVGPKPLSCPSLAGYPESDREIRALAGEVWGNCDGEAVTEHRCGAGKAIWGKSLNQVLAGMGAPPDFEYAGANADADLEYIHRKDGPADIFFVSNQKYRAEEVVCTFRVAGKAPELWDPDSGRIDRMAAYVQEQGRTKLSLHLDPGGSVFVIFGQPADAGAIVSVDAPRGKPNELPLELHATGPGQAELLTWSAGQHNLRTASGKMVRADAPRLPEPLLVGGKWDLRFPAGSGAPERIELAQLISWTKHGSDGVRHFSGTATYTQEFDVPASWLPPDRVACLDLGRVKEMAEVILNGKPVRTLWRPPFRVDITGQIKPGRNRIEIRVTNLWPNRLIGDVRLPQEKRVASSSWNPFTPDTPLLESGLLGPVCVRAGVRVRVHI